MIRATREALALELATATAAVAELEGRPASAYPADTVAAPAVWVDNLELAPSSSTESTVVVDATATVLVVTDAAPHAAGPWLDDVAELVVAAARARGWRLESLTTSTLTAAGELLEYPNRAATLTLTVPAP